MCTTTFWYSTEHFLSLISTQGGEFAVCPARLINLIYSQITSKWKGTDYQLALPPEYS